jgi:hypothetical protein
MLVGYTLKLIFMVYIDGVRLEDDCKKNMEEKNWARMASQGRKI